MVADEREIHMNQDRDRGDVQMQKYTEVRNADTLQQQQGISISGEIKGRRIALSGRRSV